ncbi:MAG TPA: PilZ domain-containing protein [Tepidisphaeraceae bacterium]|jgi:hypothetical protein
MQATDIQMLREAVSRNAGAVVSLPSAGLLRHHPTRLLLGSDEGFWIQPPPASETPLVEELMTGRKPVGVSLKNGLTKIVCTSLILRREPRLEINPQTAVEALLLMWPDELQAIQRRADYRVTLPEDGDIAIRVWRMAEHAHLRDRPLPSTLLKAAVRDLSVGGMGLDFTPGPDDPPVAAEQRLRVAVIHPEGELVLEGRVRHARPQSDGSVRLGVQFKRLADDLSGRQTMATLTQVIGQLQRTEIRRRKLALPRRSA